MRVLRVLTSWLMRAWRRFILMLVRAISGDAATAARCRGSTSSVHAAAYHRAVRKRCHHALL